LEPKIEFKIQNIKLSNQHLPCRIHVFLAKQNHYHWWAAIQHFAMR